MRKLFESMECMDVTLIVDNDRIPAHKGVLTARSEYFRAMFTSQFVESDMSEVRPLNIQFSVTIILECR